MQCLFGNNMRKFIILVFVNILLQKGANEIQIGMQSAYRGI